MGIFGSSSCSHTPAKPKPYASWHIMEMEERHGRLIAEVLYPDGGPAPHGQRVLLMFAPGVGKMDLIMAGTLDPNPDKIPTAGNYAPIARFMPIPEGWHLARTLANALHEAQQKTVRNNS